MCVIWADISRQPRAGPPSTSLITKHHRFIYHKLIQSQMLVLNPLNYGQWIVRGAPLGIPIDSIPITLPKYQKRAPEADSFINLSIRLLLLSNVANIGRIPWACKC